MVVGQGDDGSIPPAVGSKLKQFRSDHVVCLSEEIKNRWARLSGVYQVSMPRDANAKTGAN